MIKGHTGYYGCSWCKIEGNYIDHRMVFPQEGRCSLRKQEEIAEKSAKVTLFSRILTVTYRKYPLSYRKYWKGRRRLYGCSHLSGAERPRFWLRLVVCNRSYASNISGNHQKDHHTLAGQETQGRRLFSLSTHQRDRQRILWHQSPSRLWSKTKETQQTYAQFQRFFSPFFSEIYH